LVKKGTNVSGQKNKKKERESSRNNGGSPIEIAPSITETGSKKPEGRGGIHEKGGVVGKKKARWSRHRGAKTYLPGRRRKGVLRPQL